MKLQADSVPADLANDRVSVFHGVLMDFATHVTQICPGNDVFKPDLHALFCDIHQTLLLGGNITDAEHSG